MKVSIFLISVATISLLFLSGCATVHQSPSVDKNRLAIYGVNAESADSTNAVREFSLGLAEAVEVIASTCYELEIPLYYPLQSRNEQRARVTSGVFLARCDIDCKCGKEGASGHGAKSATGLLVVDLEDRGTIRVPSVSVKISSMFYRTQSTGGDYGSTSNLYFDSLGRIEERLLAQLTEASTHDVESTR